MKPAYSIDFILERTKIMIEISNLSEYIKEFQFEEKQLKSSSKIKRIDRSINVREFLD
jgi:hypothetical protein